MELLWMDPLGIKKMLNAHHEIKLKVDYFKCQTLEACDNLSEISILATCLCTTFLVVDYVQPLTMSRTATV